MYLIPCTWGFHFVLEEPVIRQEGQVRWSQWAWPPCSPCPSFLASPNSWPLRMGLCCPWGLISSSASGTRYCQ